MITKLNKIKDSLNKKFYEREEEIEGLLVSLLSGQHMFLVGLPGTGKSYLASELSKLVQGSNYFEWQLGKYTTPEELFGALRLDQFEKGIHVRNTQNKLPEANFAYLDEIFKGSSAILNTLLKIMNERVFDNNGQMKVPLISLIGASNELPEEDEGLEAMYDRLLLKYEVKPLLKRESRIKMRKGIGQNVTIPSITMEELTEYQLFTQMVDMPDSMHENLEYIFIDLLDEGIRVSDRRTYQSINALKARAFLNNRDVVIEEDMMILQHIFWNTLEEKEVAQEIIKEHAQDKITNTLDRVRSEAKDILNSISKDANMIHNNVVEIGTKLKELATELEHLKRKNPDRNEEINEVVIDLENERRNLLEVALEPIS